MAQPIDDDRSFIDTALAIRYRIVPYGLRGFAVEHGDTCTAFNTSREPEENWRAAVAWAEAREAAA